MNSPYYQPYYLREDELEHFGIKGMKWGIRRYQNQDGTLTDLGKKRYGTAENLQADRQRKKEIAIKTAKVVGGVAASVALSYVGGRALSTAIKSLNNAQAAQATAAAGSLINKLGKKSVKDLDAERIARTMETKRIFDNLRAPGNVASKATNNIDANRAARSVNTYRELEKLKQYGNSVKDAKSFKPTASKNFKVPSKAALASYNYMDKWNEPIDKGSKEYYRYMQAIKKRMNRYKNM